MYLQTRDKLIELSSVMDCYFSHEWGKDSYGRSIDDRVTKINKYLRVLPFPNKPFLNTYLLLMFLPSQKEL